MDLMLSMQNKIKNNINPLCLYFLEIDWHNISLFIRMIKLCIVNNSIVEEYI